MEGLGPGEGVGWDRAWLTLGLGDRAWLTHTAQYHQELLLRKAECVLGVFQNAQQAPTGAVLHH